MKKLEGPLYACPIHTRATTKALTSHTLNLDRLTSQLSNNHGLTSQNLNNHGLTSQTPNDHELANQTYIDTALSKIIPNYRTTNDKTSCALNPPKPPN